jgi:hypothetical protein
MVDPEALKAIESSYHPPRRGADDCEGSVFKHRPILGDGEEQTALWRFHVAAGGGYCAFRVGHRHTDRSFEEASPNLLSWFALVESQE